MDVPAPLSASALEWTGNKVNLTASSASRHLLVSILLPILLCSRLLLGSASALTHFGCSRLIVRLNHLAHLALQLFVFIEISRGVHFVDPVLWSDLKQSCHQKWRRSNCHAGGAFIPGKSASMQLVLWLPAEVSQSIHAPGNLSGKGSNHNGKEEGIVEEPLENVEVFGGDLSAIDFIEEHEEDKGDEDVLFMLLEGRPLSD